MTHSDPNAGRESARTDTGKPTEGERVGKFVEILPAELDKTGSSGHQSRDVGANVSPFVEVLSQLSDEQPVQPRSESSAEDQLAACSARAEERKEPRPKLRALIALGTCVAAGIAYGVALWVAQQLERWGLLAVPLIAVLGVVAGAIVIWASAEVRGLRRLRSLGQVQQDLSFPGSDRSAMARFEKAAEEFGAGLQGDAKIAFQKFIEMRNGDYTAQERRDYFTATVLGPADEAARYAVEKATFDTFALVALSPSTAIDALAFGIRAATMVRAVASAYGYRPGQLGTVLLLRRVLADISVVTVTSVVAPSVAGGVDDAIEAASELGEAALSSVPGAGVAIKAVGRVTGVVAAAVGDELVEGAVAGWRMAQLGLLAISVCRPMVLRDSERMRFARQVRSQLLRLRFGRRVEEASGKKDDRDPSRVERR